MGLIAHFIFFTLVVHAFEIKKIKGDANVKRNGELIVAKKKMKLLPGDLLITAKRARVQLADSGHRIWIGQNTKFRIEGLANEEDQGVLDLVYGKFRAKVKKGKDKAKYRYKMPTAVAGVRGTEFFAEANDSGDTLCTLEGVVTADLKQGGQVIVPAGKGLSIQPGRVPRLSDNSPFLVDQWVGQTAFEDESISVFDGYEFSRKRNSTESGIVYGAFGWAFYCHTANPDRNNQTSEVNAQCFRGYLSPFIGYGERHSVFFRPAINVFDKNTVATIDPVPLTKEKSHTALSIAEAYYGYHSKDVELKLGQQQIEWAGGELLSKRLWSPEPMTHVGASLWYALSSNWQLDLLATSGTVSPSVLDGKSQVRLTGIKLALPTHLAELYTLKASFRNDDSNSGLLFWGRELVNYGLYSKNKLADQWDYEFSLIQQEHSLLVRRNGDMKPANGIYTDLNLGYTFGKSIGKHLSLRYLQASENFVGIHEDWYQLGASGVFSKRLNLNQLRFKAAFQLNENRQFFIEYLSTQQVSENGIQLYSSNSGSNIGLGSEIDLIFTEKFETWQLIAGLWRFVPENMAGEDPSHGFIARLLWHL